MKRVTIIFKDRLEGTLHAQKTTQTWEKHVNG